EGGGKKAGERGELGEAVGEAVAEFALAAAKERGVEDGVAGAARARRGVEYFAGFGRADGITGGLARLLRIDFAGDDAFAAAEPGRWRAARVTIIGICGALAHS